MDNPFQSILTEFRAAYERFGEGKFSLLAFTTRETLEACQREFPRNFRSIGRVDLGEKRTYWIGAIANCDEFVGWEFDDDPISKFKKLAATAGVELPPHVINKIGDPDIGAIDRWLRVMWYFKPPPDETLHPLDDGSVVYKQPFLQSMDIIKNHLLGEDSSQHQPSKKEEPTEPNQRQLDELKIIRDFGPIPEKTLTKKLHDDYEHILGDGTFRSTDVPLLKQHGVKNDGQGYYISK